MQWVQCTTCGRRLTEPEVADEMDDEGRCGQCVDAIVTEPLQYVSPHYDPPPRCRCVVQPAAPPTTLTFTPTPGRCSCSTRGALIKVGDLLACSRCGRSTT